jgi:hypothetical protein
MNKKDYISKILDKLYIYWPLARWLKVLLNEDKLNDDQIAWLLSVFEHAIKETWDKIEKEKLQKWIDLIKKLKSLEEDWSKQDSKDVQELDKILENI